MSSEGATPPAGGGPPADPPAGGPPLPGPPPRDPTAPARLLDAAADVGLRVERAHRRLDDLERALERLAAEATRAAAR
jgi:hypothetical protein